MTETRNEGDDMVDRGADTMRQAVRERYGEIARHGGQDAGCGQGATGCCSGGGPPATATAVSRQLGYSDKDLLSIPADSDMGLGCGNPQAIADLRPGETVLDLGSGGGIDCFLAANQVGEAGHVIGVDMTPDMVSKARENAAKTELDNVEFRLGEIEHLPLADESVDVIVSNCVINLSTDKPGVYAEALRVLKPGGRLAISDVVATAEIPDEFRVDLSLYTGCVSNSATAGELQGVLDDAGFQDIRIQTKEGSRELIHEWVPGRSLEDYVVSATIEAVKPRLDPDE